MTLVVWQGWLAATVLYLGTFLGGLRPARWVGTRLLPIVAALFLACLFTAPIWRLSFEIPILVIVDLLLVAVILFVAQTRDYS